MNYDFCADSMQKGVRMEDDERISPNYPPGYRYEKWNIDEIMDDLAQGKEVYLGEGDWS